MSLFGETCGVRIYGPRAEHHCCDHGCSDCQIGCFNPVAYRNPMFGKEFNFDPETYWWRSMYSYTEYLCAQHYDEMVRFVREEEDVYRELDPNYVECPEFTRFLETL